MNRAPPWELFATFLAVMRGGSLSAAARNLRFAQPTVRRHIDQLEASLGVVLFTRSQTGLTATAAARQMLAYAETMAATADALVRAASDDGLAVKGTVRIGCSEMMAARVVPAMLAPLLAAHDDLTIELAASDRTDDLLRRDADIAIRMTRPTQQALVARRIGTVAIGLYASDGYLARHPAPRSITDLLAGQRLIDDDRGTTIGDALAGIGIDPALIRVALRTDSHPAQLAAIRAGIGIGVCQRGIAATLPELHAVLPELEVGLETWLLMHEDLKGQPRVRAVFDHLAGALTVYCKR